MSPASRRGARASGLTVRCRSLGPGLARYHCRGEQVHPRLAAGHRPRRLYRGHPIHGAALAVHHRSQGGARGYPQGRRCSSQQAGLAPAALATLVAPGQGRSAITSEYQPGGSMLPRRGRLPGAITPRCVLAHGRLGHRFGRGCSPLAAAVSRRAPSRTRPSPAAPVRAPPPCTATRGQRGTPVELRRAHAWANGLCRRRRESRPRQSAHCSGTVCRRQGLGNPGLVR